MYKITLVKGRTCVEIEQELGLSRGAVAQVLESPEGIVDVYFKQEPSADQKSTLQAALNMKITSEVAE